MDTSKNGLFPKNIEQKLGFDHVRNQINDLCISTLGQSFVQKIRFSERPEIIDKLLRQTEEMQRIVAFHAEFPTQYYLDIRPSLQKARVEGMFLEEAEWHDISLTLRTARALYAFFASTEGFPTLGELAAANAAQPSILADLAKQISTVIDDRGRLRDNASPALGDIRKQLVSEQLRLRKTLESMLRTANQNGWIPEGASIAIRNGRMVIPLAAEHKRKVRGFIQDESESGKIVFIEPADALDANNEIFALEARERREIVRILTVLTDNLRPHTDTLRQAITFMGLMDFLRAKARFGLKIKAIAPIFRPQKTGAVLRAARHPLLEISLQKQGKTVIPLDVQLDIDGRIVVVSGPNAGGKSIMLKTIGLLQYMLQCGLTVPVGEGSEMGYFRNIFLDIGDEQSLENDLSTYSSHLAAMRFFLNRANEKTLFLIDEFGTGTEPNLGGAIAESILADLHKKGAFGVVNTHYGNLKTFAAQTDGIKNAAMRFDVEHLEPLYQLEIGKPGSSFAFEVATKMGLPKAVIEAARQKLDRHQVNFERLSKELEIERKVFQERNVANLQKQQELDRLTEQYSTLRTYLDNEKKRLLNEAKSQAKQLVQDANARIEQVIREIREQQADKVATKEIRSQLIDFQEKNLQIEKTTATAVPEKTKKKAPQAEESIELTGGEIVVGALVRVKDQTTLGEVIEIKGKEAVVRVGELRTTLKINRLERVSRKEYKASEEVKPSSMRGVNLNEKAVNFSFNLDVRGSRGEEALQKVDAFLDDAIMLGYPELRIIHGKGDGILRQLIRNSLRGYSQVATLTDDHPDRGGAGITIVKMK